MPEWARLIDLDRSSYLSEGTVFRFSPTAGYVEHIIDFLLCASMRSDVAFDFFVASGHKAGLCAASVPHARLPMDCQRALRVGWLIENWYDAVFEACDLAEVHCGRRGVPRALPAPGNRRAP